MGRKPKIKADELELLGIGEEKGKPTLSMRTIEKTRYFLPFSAISPLMRTIITERFRMDAMRQPLERISPPKNEEKRGLINNGDSRKD